jgi:hypothetical protein
MPKTTMLGGPKATKIVGGVVGSARRVDKYIV